MSIERHVLKATSLGIPTFPRPPSSFSRQITTAYTLFFPRRNKTTASDPFRSWRIELFFIFVPLPPLQPNDLTFFFSVPVSIPPFLTRFGSVAPSWFSRVQIPLELRSRPASDKEMRLSIQSSLLRRAIKVSLFPTKNLRGPHISYMIFSFPL